MLRSILDSEPCHVVGHPASTEIAEPTSRCGDPDMRTSTTSLAGKSADAVTPFPESTDPFSHSSLARPSPPRTPPAARAFPQLTRPVTLPPHQPPQLARAVTTNSAAASERSSAISSTTVTLLQASSAAASERSSAISAPVTLLQASSAQHPVQCTCGPNSRGGSVGTASTVTAGSVGPGPGAGLGLRGRVCWAAPVDVGVSASVAGGPAPGPDLGLPLNPRATQDWVAAERVKEWAQPATEATHPPRASSARSTTGSAHQPNGGSSMAASDTDAESQLLLRSSKRSRMQLVLYCLAGLACLVVGLAAGLELVGWPYDPDWPVENETSGQLRNAGQLIGIYFFIYLGTAGVVTLVNFIPSVAAIGMSAHTVCTIVGLLLAGCVAGVVCCMAFLVQPQDTFADTPAVGSIDPVRATAGVFFGIGFAFLGLLCCGVLVRQPGLAGSWARVCGWLRRCGGCLVLAQPRAKAFVAFYIFLA